MKSLIRLIVIAMAVLGCVQTHGQSFFSDIKKPEFQPPSPEASSLGRFGQYAVNNSTGTPDISIPIYSIQLPNFTFPISISYSATGVKLSEVGGRLGIGWALEAGGTLSRNVMGLNDHSYTRNIPPVTFSPVWANINQPSPADYNLATDLLNQSLYDTEPDVWYYNFLGYSGKFTENENGWVPLPFTNEVIYDPATSEFVDARGNKYQFFAFEFVSTQNYCNTSNVRNNRVPNESGRYLTRVITANGDSISLTYDSESYSYFQSYSQKKYFRNNESMNCPLDDESMCVTVGGTNVPRVKQIVSSSGVIVDFVYDSIRRDVEGGDAKLLNKIIVRHANSSEEFTYKFEHEYVQSQIPMVSYGPTRPSDRMRVYLKKFTDRSDGIYNFNYYDRESIPAKNSFKADHWGYYNGAENLGLLPSYSPVSFSGANRAVSELNVLCGSLNRITYPTGGYTNFELEAHKADSIGVLGGGVRIKSISNYTATGVLADKKTYKYHTSKIGFTEEQLSFNYVDQSIKRMRMAENTACVLNDVCDYYILSSTTVPVCGGSDFNSPVRYGKVEVKQISGSSDLGKSIYYYSNLYYQTGWLTLKLDGLDQVYPTKEEHYRSTDSSYQLIKKKELSYVVKNDISAGISPTGNVPNYRQVIGFRVRYELPEELTNCMGTELGDTFFPAVFTFDHYKYISVWHFNNSIIETSYAWKDDVNKDSLRTYQFLRYDRPVHAQVTSSITVDSNGDTLKTITRYPEDYTSGGIIDLASYYQFHYRSIPIESYVLDKNNFLLSAQLNELRKVGNALRLNKKYTTHIAAPLNATTAFPALNNQSVSISFPPSSPYEIVYDIASYDSRNNPQEIIPANNIKQVYFWDAAKHNVQALATSDSTDVIAFTNFDISSHGGWTYSDTYSSAEKFSYPRSFSGTTISRSGLISGKLYKVTAWVKGTAPSIQGGQVTGSSVTAGDLGNWSLYEWTFKGSTDPLVITIASGTKLDDLRIHPLRNNMETFSHHPLLGLLSKTDANNVTQYFEYDGAGRLKAIRDHKGNILKTFQYNFVNGEPQ